MSTIEYEREAAEAEAVETRVSFSTPASGEGVKIRDPIDRNQFELYTEGPVEPTPTGTDQFLAPVDVAAAIETSSISYENILVMYVRDEAGDLLAEVEHSIHREFPEATYIIEISPPIKLYLRIEGSFSVSTDTQRTYLEFDEPTEVHIGARSHHEHPAGTITTTADPRDMMEAISALGSALKTTSPERSFPTLRGHPPLIEIGDELDIPEGLERPDTGIHLELPPETTYIYEAAPLAYYLGADIREADSPALVTDSGFYYPLEGHISFQESVERTLKQVFFLDCITRTEGFYSVDLHERHEVEPLVSLDFADLYDKPVQTQLSEYLSVPFETIRDHIPEWKLTTHVDATPEGIETLPFALNELAVVRAQEKADITTPAAQATAIEGFSRRGEMTRSASAEGGKTLDTVVKPDSGDSLGQAWIGDGAPIGATKGSVKAFNNRLERTPQTGDISIAVVLNDNEMGEEREFIDEVYGSRKKLPFDVSYHHDLTTAELEALLEREVDFLHYIGHVDDEGFECADGKLDVRDMEEVGVDSFLLNACLSYDQGMAMIEAGAIGGVVTLREVINSGAVKVGKTMARLLNRGFPLRAALNLSQGESVIGEQYIVVGDGELAITQSESGAPVYAEVSKDGELYETTIRSYPTTNQGMGSLIMPFIKQNYTHYLNSGALNTFTLTERELREALTMEEIPVITGSDLQWSTDLDLSSL